MISIIVPVFNKEKYISNTITSILNQTYKDFELIIINDGSTDNSLDIVKSLDDKRIKIYSTDNNGVSYARNLGIKKAKYENLVFIDADDYIEENMLEELVSHKEDFVVCGFYSETINGSKERFHYKDLAIKGKKEIRENLITLYSHDLMVNTWNKLFRKKIIDKYNIKFTGIHFGEDNQFCMDYLVHCNSIYNIDKCLYHYIRELNNSVTMNYIDNFFDIRLNENKAFAKTFDFFKIDKNVYQKFIAKRFIERTLGCLENLHRKNDLKFNDKLKETKRIINSREVKKYLNIYKSKNKKINFILSTYKYKNGIITYFIGKGLYIIKKLFPRYFNRCKNKR